MANPNSDKHKEYARYAAHCLMAGAAADDPDSEAIQRKMALEWLRLAESVLHPLDLHANVPLRP
jgi:hypothetical protein